jgi:hypothetical protein
LVVETVVVSAVETVVVLTVEAAEAVEIAVVLAVVEIVETVEVSAVIVTTDLEVQDLKAITVAVNTFLYKKGGHFKNDRLFFCYVLNSFCR